MVRCTSASKQPKIDPEALYVAWDGASIGPHSFSAGVRLRGDTRPFRRRHGSLSPMAREDEIAGLGRAVCAHALS